MKGIKYLFITACLVVFGFCGDCFAAKFRTFDHSRKVKKISCAWNGKKWIRVKAGKGSNIGKYKKIKKKKQNQQGFKKDKKARKSCRRQSNPTVATLSNTPSGGDFIPEVVTVNAVSGTPPAYTEITNSSALSLYWREVEGENVVSALEGGSPTDAQCEEFYGGDTDGESGGLPACEANIDAVRALVKPLESGISSCYLRNIPTQANVDGGGLSIVDGTFPASHVENLFSVPAGSDSRIVKLEIRNGDVTQDIFAKVFSFEENTANSNNYQIDLWFCDEGQDAGTPFSVESVTIGEDNSFVNTVLSNQEDDTTSVQFSGALVQEEDGGYEFDSSAATDASIRFTVSEQVAFGYDISVEDGVITLKKHEVENDDITKSYVMFGYTGDVESLAMTEGASSVQVLSGDTVVESSITGFEFRDSFYAVTASSDLLSSVQSSADFTETFFSETPTATFSAGDYTCGQTPEITVQIDMTAVSMTEIIETCEGFVPENTNFCSNDILATAEENYFTQCTM